MQNATRQKWEGRWEQLTGRVKSLWADVTDDELLKAEGDYERLVGVVKEKTGQTREEIEEKLED
ncbi:MAG: CsbD family protein [Gemmataceae bacterium]